MISPGETGPPRRSPRTAGLVLAAAGAISLLLFLASTIGPLAPPGGKSGAATYSLSAIGYRGLATWLKTGDVPVELSRENTGGKSRDSTLVFILSPELNRPGEADRFHDVVAELKLRNAWIVLVLPKWTARSSPDNPHWISNVSLLPLERVQHVLDEFTTALNSGEDPGERTIRVFRPPPGAPGGEASLVLPQLISGPVLTAVTGDASGNLIAAIAARCYIIADGDLLNNTGLSQGENARLVHDFMTAKPLNRILIDESIRGTLPEKSLWAELVSFPLILITLHMAGLLALLVWTAGGRFGKPMLLPDRNAPGKRALIDNTADLLTASGRPAQSLKRYFQQTIAGFSPLVGIPADLPEEERLRRLTALAGRRGIPFDGPGTKTRIEALSGSAQEIAAVLEIATSVHELARRMTGGTRESPR